MAGDSEQDETEETADESEQVEADDDGSSASELDKVEVRSKPGSRDGGALMDYLRSRSYLRTVFRKRSANERRAFNTAWKEEAKNGSLFAEVVNDMDKDKDHK